MIDSGKIKKLFPDYLDKCNREYYIIDREWFFFSKEDALKHLSDLLKDGGTEFINVECCEAVDKRNYAHILNKVPKNHPDRFNILQSLERVSGNDPVVAYYFYDESLDGESVLEGTFFAFESQEHLDIFVREQAHSDHNVVIQIQ